MRSVAACVISLALGCASGASIAPQATTTRLTLVYQFDHSYSDRMFQETKHELEFILKDSGIQVDWRDRAGVGSSESFKNLVVVKFRGACEVGEAMDSNAELGPLAFTYRSEGAILPFSEVKCDRILSTLRGVLSGVGHGRAGLLLGRALARVLAHELYHVLAGTESHAGKGVAQRALSGVQLVSDQLGLDQDELNRMLR